MLTSCSSEKWGNNGLLSMYISHIAIWLVQGYLIHFLYFVDHSAMANKAI